MGELLIVTVKTVNTGAPKIIAVIILKLEQGGLENLHMDRTTNCMFWAITKADGKVGIP